MARFGKHNIGEARQFLASLPDVKFGKPLSQLSPDYVTRQANAISRQLAAGLPANRQAARGHITTPEHGKFLGGAPKVSTEYRATRATGLTPNVPRGLKTFPNGTRQYVGGRGMAREAIKDAAALDKRVEVRVFNKQTGQWQTAYENRGHSAGISAKHLQEMAEQNGRGVLEQAAIDSLGGGDSAGGHELDFEEMAEIFDALMRGEVPEETPVDLGDYSLWEVNVL